MLPNNASLTLYRVERSSFDVATTIYRLLIDEYGFTESWRKDFLFREKGFPGVFELLSRPVDNSAEWLDRETNGRYFDMVWVTSDSSVAILRLKSVEKLRKLMELFDLKPAQPEPSFSI